jgi:KDO2-lipid IV(A) lauroyltransferase
MAVNSTITLQHRLEHWGLRAYLNLFKGMSLERASDTGASLMAAFGPLTTAHGTALKNLRLAFPNESEKWRRDVAKAMWAGIGRTVGEFPHLARFKPYTEESRIDVVGAEKLDAVKASGKGAVFISGHFCNWELMPVAIAQRGVLCHMTYRPPNNPLFDEEITKVRMTTGASLQAAKGKEGGMALLRGLARGEAVALMNDQKYNEGVAAPFFGHEAMTADGPTRMALRYGVPLIPFSARRLPGVRYRITIHDPLPIRTDIPQADAVRETVIAINAFIEARVREAPEEWFWVHKRWPKEAWG